MYLPSEKDSTFKHCRRSTKIFVDIGIGYDDNKGNLGRENIPEPIFRFQNTWRPVKQLTVNTGIYYTDTRTESGRNELWWDYNDKKFSSTLCAVSRQ